MNKLLLTFLIATVGYESSIQGMCIINSLPICCCQTICAIIAGNTTNYKWLSNLPKRSKIRNTCEQLRGAMWWKGVSEIQCDKLNEEFFTLASRESDTILQKFEGLKESSKVAVLLSTPHVISSITPEKKLEILNAIDVILPNISNEEKKEEFDWIISYPYMIAAEELYKQTQMKEMRGLQIHLGLVKETPNTQ